MTWKKHLLLAFLFLLIVVAVLSESSGFAIYEHIFLSNETDKGLRQEPIFSPLKFGIGNVNATVIVYPSFYQVRLFIQYIGGGEPVIQDTLLVPKEFELIDVRTVDSDMNVIATVTSLDNQSIIFLNFSRFLLPSEIMNLVIIGNVAIDTAESFLSLPVWWNYSRPAGIVDIRILLFPGIDYADSNPQPSRIRPAPNGFLELWWIDIFTSGFSTVLSVVITQVARNEILVSPTFINLNTTLNEVSVSMFLANVGTTTVNITVSLPEGVRAQKKFLVLKPFEQEKIDLLVSGEESREINGNIEIHTNRTSNPIIVPVRIELQKPFLSPDKNLLIAIVLLVALLAMVRTGFLYRYRSRKDDHILLIPKTTPAPPSDLSIDEQAVLQMLEKAKTRIGERRATILEYIYRNPGCSQQEVAEKFGFSKATISREIQKLEAQGYIMKKRQGMSHQLFLTRKIMNKKKP